MTRPSTPTAKGRTEAGLGQVGRDGGCPTAEWERAVEGTEGIWSGESGCPSETVRMTGERRGG